MRYAFSFKPLMALFYVVFCSIFISLGIWQWHRYHYKLRLMNTYHLRQTKAPVNLAYWLTHHQVRDIEKGLLFAKVQAHGHYVANKVLLLANQTHNGRAGVDVLNLFELSPHSPWLLVNRGFMTLQTMRQQPKRLLLDNQLSQVVGMVKVENEYRFTLGPDVFNPGSWPLKFQRFNWSLLSKAIHHDLYPFVIRQAPSSPNGFVRQWQVISVPPTRHLGYCIQWYLMALALTICFVIFSNRYRKES